MARPLRVQFAGAWYHVMNRGAGRRTVYSDDVLRDTFLDLLNDVHERYDVEIHAWCLMNNHYHLVCRTPHPNLDRAMRHVDGVYTQRHNRRRRTDGPLFRGRYKSILVDSDAYLAQLTRYVHRNPADAGMVRRPEDWRWSSYRSYLKRSEPAQWLFMQEVLSLFGQRNPRRGYRAFVEQGVDSEIAAFFAQTPLPAVLGSRDFRERMKDKLRARDITEIPDSRRCHDRPDLDTIVATTAATFGVTPDDILTAARGQRNLPRAIAMALCQSPGGCSLKVIAKAFGLTSHNAASAAISRVRGRFTEPEIGEVVSSLRARLFGPV